MPRPQHPLGSEAVRLMRQATPIIRSFVEGFSTYRDDLYPEHALRWPGTCQMGSLAARRVARLINRDLDHDGQARIMMRRGVSYPGARHEHYLLNWNDQFIVDPTWQQFMLSAGIHYRQARDLPEEESLIAPKAQLKRYAAYAGAWAISHEATLDVREMYEDIWNMRVYTPACFFKQRVEEAELCFKIFGFDEALKAEWSMSQAGWPAAG